MIFDIFSAASPQLLAINRERNHFCICGTNDTHHCGKSRHKSIVRSSLQAKSVGQHCVLSTVSDGTASQQPKGPNSGEKEIFEQSKVRVMEPQIYCVANSYSLFQGYLESNSNSATSPGSDLAVWSSCYQQAHHSVCLALYHLQLSPGSQPLEL